MKTILEEGNRTIVLISPDQDEEIDLEDITTVNYSNLYGEAVTISALLNKIGLLKADYERRAKEAKLDCDVYESELKKNYRKEAQKNGGKVYFEETEVKLTEKGLEELVLLNETYQKLQLEKIDLETKRDKIDALWWAIKSKDSKLNNLLPKITPKEFAQEIIEEKVNSFIIKKPIL